VRTGTRIGLVGCGRWGRFVLRDLVALGSDVTAAVRSADGRASALEGGATSAVETVDDLPEPEGIVVATPTETHAAVVERALERGAAVLPGVCTPTEVEMGLARGLDAFKFFPAEAAGGRPFLAALGGPYPHVRFVPTGGIDASMLEGYLALPNVLACGGSWMVSRKLLEAGDMATVRRLAGEATDIVAAARRTPAS
jgi:2-dehydro-3-deoxyphosphogluconate aldolase/(4S)-4-hydroxy-2-oxoglutarate aldolase